MNFRKSFALAVSLIIIIFTVSACSNTASAPLNNSMSSSSSSKPKESQKNDLKHSKDLISTDKFYPINNAVSQRFFEDTANAYSSHKVDGEFDFDGDGKKEALKVDFTISDDDSTNAEVTVGSSTEKLTILGLAGVYAVKFNVSTDENLLAIVEYNTDNYIITHFFRYKDGKLIKLGELEGSFTIDLNRQPYTKEYNEQLLIDGYGDIIPRYSVMKFVSPSITLFTYKLDGNSFNKISTDPNTTLSSEYIVTSDIKPFFEQGNYNSQNYIPKCNPNDIMEIKSGEKIKILNVSTKQGNQECILVRLSNGKQGILYFFLTA